MSNYHILDQTKKKERGTVVFHYSVPNNNNIELDFWGFSGDV